MGYRLIQWMMRWLLRVCFRMEVTGEARIPRTGPVILAANHPSQIDPVALGAALPRRVAFLAAAELLTMPVVGALVRRFRPVPVKRGQFDLRAIKDCLNRLSRGEALLVFPEGKISPDGRLQPARDGLAFLALRSGVPVVPIGIRGSYDVWPLGTRFPRRGRIEVRIGQPIIPQGDLSREGQTAVTSRVMEAIAGLAGELPCSEPCRGRSAVREPGPRGQQRGLGSVVDLQLG